MLDIAKLLYEKTGVKMLDPAVTNRLDYNQLHNKVIDTYIENLTKVAIGLTKRFLSENADDEAVVNELQMLCNIDEESARWVLEQVKAS